jgi:DNA-binding SARP family transcriptional activator
MERPGMELLSIKLLGPPEARFGGRGLRFGRKKALALLAYLAANGRKYPRRDLAELLWPKSEERRARTDLRSILTNLRKTLEEGGTSGHGNSEGLRFLAIDGDLLGVEPRGIELDLGTLEAAVSLARGETSETSPGDRSVDDAVGSRDLSSRLDEALGIYRGDFMEGFSLEDTPEFELWLEAERARWRQVFGELCERASRFQVEAGRLQEAIGTTRIWTKHAPLEEAAHRRLVEALSSAGDSEGALLAYEHFRGALEGELGIEPSPQMKGLNKRLQREIEGRASFGASLTRSARTASLAALDVPFAGRREEFGALVSEYHAVLEGEAREVAVLGEAGMGKTRLGNEFLGWARARGADVLKGEASEDARLPYGPLIEAIRPRIERERAPDDLLEDAWLSELSRLLPELKERYPDLPPAPSGEGETARAGLFEAITRTVGALASRAPLVLFLDNLHWADSATVEVLNYAERRWTEQGAPVLVLTAARPEEPPTGSSGFGRWLSASRRSSARSLTLGPLGNEEVEDLLRRLTGVEPRPAGPPKNPEVPNEARSGLRSFGEWLALESGGQPFYLTETLKALLENGDLVARSRAHAEAVVEISPSFRAANNPAGLLPSSVREVIRSRLSQLSTAAFDLLSAGAVLGRGFGFEPLLALSGLGEAEGLRGLDELTGRRLLLEDGNARGGATPLQQSATYSFSHEKIRQVVYTEGGQARRLVLHRRAFEVLQGSGAPPAELARQALAGGLADEALAYAVAAGDAAAEVFAVRDAIVHYERARDVLVAGERQGTPLKTSIPHVERLYAQLGRAHELTDEWGEARAAYETMLAFARGAGDARLEVVALNHLAVFYFRHERDVPEASTLLEVARLVAEEAGLEGVLAETECNLVDVTALRTGDFDQSWPVAEKALASARALERPDLVARTLTTLALWEILAGRLEEATAHAEEGAALSRRLSEASTPVRTTLPSMLVGPLGLSASWRAGNKAMETQALTYLAYGRNFQGRPREGLAAAREARAISKDLPERIEAMSLAALAMALQETGEYQEALSLARRGTERAREVQDAFLLGSNLGGLGEVYEALMYLEKARAAYGEAAERGHYGAFSNARFCVLAALSNDWEEAYVQAKKAHELGAFVNPLLSVHLHHGVEALLRGGDERLARVQVQGFAERAEANRRDRMSHLRSLAALEAWEGDTKRAIDNLQGAEALAEEIGLPGPLWQIQARIGEIREQRGEAGEAREAYSRAAQTLKMLAERIEDKGLREDFLSAPRVRSVLEHD